MIQVQVMVQAVMEGGCDRRLNSEFISKEMSGRIQMNFELIFNSIRELVATLEWE